MLQNARILRLDKSGLPLDWLTRQEAVTLIVKDMVLWSVGEERLVMRGGYNRCGVRSVIHLPSIIATSGDVVKSDRVAPMLTNRLLFRRDQNLCLYCGNTFAEHELTRDHIIARSRGGQDRWTNVATSCRRCNQRKGQRAPEEAGMPLLAVPFVPNKMEYMVLANRNILANQMEFLKSGFSKHMRYT